MEIYNKWPHIHKLAVDTQPLFSPPMQPGNKATLTHTGRPNEERHDVKIIFVPSMLEHLEFTQL